MVEFLFDTSTAYFFPTLSSQILTCMDELHEEQDPPFSYGLYFLLIRNRFMEKKWSNKMLFGNLCEPVFTVMVRESQVYCNPNMAKFASRKINENYKTFGENMGEKFPGYVLAKDGKIRVQSDLRVDLDALLKLLRSKDIALYEKHRDKFFGQVPRYTTG